MTAAERPGAGLSSVEALRRLAQYGPNDPAPKKQRSHLVELLLQFANPLVAVLTSVTLARGAVAMAKHKVIVKHLSAIQNLGSIDILCSDKTGTLTRGIMAFDSSCDALGRATAAPLFFARLNSTFETGIRSPLDTAILAQAEAEGSSAYAKLDEIPFDFERRRLSIVVDDAGERSLIAKTSAPSATSC